MKIVFQSLIILLVLSSCNSLRKGTQRRFPEQIVVATDDEMLITETFARYEEPNAIQPDKNDEQRAEKPQEAQVRSAEIHEKAIGIPAAKDSLTVTSDEVKIALESERIARNAHIWSFVPLLSIAFGFLALLPGVVVTLILINKVKKMPFVTQYALDKIRKARRTLLWTTVGLLVGFIILVLLIFIFTLLLF